MTPWYLVAVSLPVKIDAQKNPVPALAIFAAICVLLWFLTAQARRRDTRRAARRLGSETRGPETRGPDTRGSDSRGSDSRGSDSRGSDSRGSDSWSRRPPRY